MASGVTKEWPDGAAEVDHGHHQGRDVGDVQVGRHDRSLLARSRQFAVTDSGWERGENTETL